MSLGRLAGARGGAAQLVHFNGSTTWVLRYPASGQWSRTALTSGSLGPLALVPGTTSLFGVGSVSTATPAANARIWAYSQAG